MLDARESFSFSFSFAARGSTTLRVDVVDHLESVEWIDDVVTVHVHIIRWSRETFDGYRWATAVEQVDHDQDVDWGYEAVCVDVLLAGWVLILRLWRATDGNCNRRCDACSTLAVLGHVFERICRPGQCGRTRDVGKGSIGIHRHRASGWLDRYRGGERISFGIPVICQYPVVGRGNRQRSTGVRGDQRYPLWSGVAVGYRDRAVVDGGDRQDEGIGHRSACQIGCFHENRRLTICIGDQGDQQAVARDSNFGDIRVAAGRLERKLVSVDHVWIEEVGRGQYDVQWERILGDR